MYFEKDVTRGVEGTFLWLMEEVGELATALRSKNDMQNLHEEFADVIAWLTTIANVAGVGLVESASREVRLRCPGCRRFDCTCPFRRSHEYTTRFFSRFDSTTTAALGLAAQSKIVGSGLAAEAELPPVRAITRGPKFHWRGYYDKLLFDPTDRFVVANEVDFEHRTPEPKDTLRIGMIDLQSKDEWIELGVTKAWNWQQGCMAQWLPGDAPRVIWNDRDGSSLFRESSTSVIERQQRSLRRFTASAPMPK